MTKTPISPIALLSLLLLGCGVDGTTESGTSSAADIESAPAVSIVGTTWEWVSTVTPVERIEAADPSRYTITLDDNGGVVARFDCNSGRGSYEMAEYRISFGVFAATRMACPEDTQDFVFMSQLERITTFFVRDAELFLEMPVDSGTMRFRPASDRN